MKHNVSDIRFTISGIRMETRKQGFKSPKEGPNKFRTRTALVSMCAAASNSVGERQTGEGDLSTSRLNLELEGITSKSE